MKPITALPFSLLLAACTPAQEPMRLISPDAPIAETTVVEVDTVDASCRSDADCAVKNVGNCCGYYPACVNRDSPTFPERVRERCEREGVSSVCGYPEIAGCRCVANACQPATDGAEAR